MNSNPPPRKVSKKSSGQIILKYVIQMETHMKQIKMILKHFRGGEAKLKKSRRKKIIIYFIIFKKIHINYLSYI